MSLVAETGEWKTRKITFFGVVKSFVSQLKIGQDLTKVSLPAILCHPYSLLEVLAYRELCMIHPLLELSDQNDPKERFLTVLRWFLGTIRQETFEKKPYNPVLGETLFSWVTNDRYGDTEFISEQVSHHPPISAFIVRNSHQKVDICSNVSFGVKFGGNSVSIVTSGGARVIAHVWKETYEMNKCLPDMVIRNVVFGTKRIYWEGDVHLTCPETGYSARIRCKEKGKSNLLKTFVNHVDSPEPILELSGQCGFAIYSYPPDKKEEKKLFLDASKETLNKLHYLPPDKMDDLYSLIVWAKVNAHIVENAMDLADKAKKFVEAEQRKRYILKKEKNEVDKAKHFGLDKKTNDWVFLENIAIQHILNSDPLPNGPESEKIKEPSNTTAITSTTSPNISPKRPHRRLRLTEEKIWEPSAEATLSDDPPLDPIEKKPLEEPPEDELNPNAVLNNTKSPQLSHSPPNSNNVEPPKPPPLSISPSSSFSGPRTSSSFDMYDPERRGKRSLKEELRSYKKLKTKERRKQKKQIKTEQKEIYKTIRVEAKKGKIKGSDDVVLSGFMKMRNTLKKWSNRYFELKPGTLVYYKDEDNAAKADCMGMIILKGCLVQIRPSKKPGFCFKIFNVMKYSIYSKQGLKGETIKKAFLPVSSDYVLLRVADENKRNEWIKLITATIPDYKRNADLTANKPSMVNLGVHGESDSESEDDSGLTSEDEDSDFGAPKTSTIKAVQEAEKNILEHVNKMEQVITNKIKGSIQQQLSQLTEKKTKKTGMRARIRNYFWNPTFLVVLLFAILVNYMMKMSNELSRLHLLKNATLL